MLRMYVAKSQDDWDERLVCAEFAINNADHESSGYSPFMLKFGYHPRLPGAIMPKGRVPAAIGFVQRMQRLVNEARVAHRVATKLQARYANTKRRDVQYEVGDWLLLSSKNLHFKVGTPKLLPRWVGPFQVVKRVGSQAYELPLHARWRIHDVFHVSNLEGYRRDSSMQPLPPAELLEGEGEYEVESIVNHRRVNSTGRSKYEYLVCWKGYPAENDTWEDERNLRNAPASVKGYWDRVDKRTTRGRKRRRGQVDKGVTPQP
jgi:Chromo (CHRromatin Organisation MOdifier) domain